jgi:hypothetical protein
LPHVADPSADTQLEQLAFTVFGDNAGVIEEVTWTAPRSQSLPEPYAGF